MARCHRCSIYTSVNKTRRCFYPARSTRHVYRTMSWALRGAGPEELVSQEDLSGVRSCTAEQRGVGAGRGAVLWDGWEAVAPGFSCTSRTPTELCHWVKRAAEDIGKKQHQSVRRASRRNDFSAAKHSQSTLAQRSPES